MSEYKWPSYGSQGIQTVANAIARLALTPNDGMLVEQLDTHELWVYDSTASAWKLETSPTALKYTWVDGTDTTGDYLGNKLTSYDTSVSFTTLNPGASELLDLAVNPAAISHGALADRTADDHSQYFLLAGRANGQTAYGGANTGDLLKLYSNAATPKSDPIYFASDLFPLGEQASLSLYGITYQCKTGGTDGNNWTVQYYKYSGTGSVSAFKTGGNAIGCAFYDYKPNFTQTVSQDLYNQLIHVAGLTDITITLTSGSTVPFATAGAIHLSGGTRLSELGQQRYHQIGNIWTNSVQSDEHANGGLNIGTVTGPLYFYSSDSDTLIDAAANLQLRGIGGNVSITTYTGSITLEAAIDLNHFADSGAVNFLAATYCNFTADSGYAFFNAKNTPLFLFDGSSLASYATLIFCADLTSAGNNEITLPAGYPASNTKVPIVSSSTGAWSYDVPTVNALLRYDSNGALTTSSALQYNNNALITPALKMFGATSGYTAFNAADTTTSVTYTLPIGDGTAGYVLKTDGAGTLSWVAQSGAGSDTWEVVMSRGSASSYTALMQNAAAAEFGKHATPNVAASLKLWGAGSNAYYTNIATGTQASSLSYTLPLSAPSAGQVLASDASGNMSWVTRLASYSETSTLNDVVGRGNSTATSVLLQNAAALELGKNAATNVAGNMKLWGAGTGNSYYSTIGTGTQSATMNYILPLSAPSAGQFLSSDSSGNMSWASALTSLAGAVLLAGRVGGQTIDGDTATAGSLTLRGNAADLTTGGVNVSTTVEATTGGAGSLTTAGGLYVAKKIITPSTLGFYTNSKTTTITGSGSATASVNYTLPPADAAASGYVLSSNSSGTLSWVAQSGGGFPSTQRCRYSDASGQYLDSSYAIGFDTLFYDDGSMKSGTGTSTLFNIATAGYYLINICIVSNWSGADTHLRLYIGGSGYVIYGPGQSGYSTPASYAVLTLCTTYYFGASSSFFVRPANYAGYMVNNSLYSFICIDRIG